jgi:hypothetical protein
VERVAVRILHPAPGASSGELERGLAAARATNAERLAQLFRSVGAGDVRVDTRPSDGRSFGERVRSIAAELGPTDGLIVLGSGSVPLLRRRAASDLVAVAASGEPRALANNRYSADVVAIGGAAALAAVPDLPTDNALPRWLAEHAGYVVEDLRGSWRLAIDLDSPLDVLIAGGGQLPTRGGQLAARDEQLHAGAAPAIDVRAVLDRLHRLKAVATDPALELVVAGRTGAATLRWLERATASRTRALIEERGLRATGGAAQRPPRSALGMILDAHGPEALGAVLAELGDAAIVDTRILLAHRLGADEAAWPAAEDRFASDLLLPERIRDPWLRALTASARDASVSVLLGGHTLVGPGIRLLLASRSVRRT